MENVYEVVAKRIKTARVKAGLTQQDVAERLGVTGANYSMIESGKVKLSLDYLVQLARLYEQPITWFLGIPDELTADERALLDLYRDAEPIIRLL